MSSVNPKWSRWTYASLHKHLHTLLDAHLGLVVHPVDPIFKEWTELPNKCEVTITGPSFQEHSANDHTANLSVFAVLTSHSGLEVNGLNHVELAGKIQNALDRCIDINQLGEGENGDWVATLEVNPREDDRVSVRNLKPGEGEKLTHSVIEAKYVGNFE